MNVTFMYPQNINLSQSKIKVWIMIDNYWFTFCIIMS